MHAVCIFPFRGYDLTVGVILYAKSSLELIVNNRIGKVGIRPADNLFRSGSAGFPRISPSLSSRSCRMSVRTSVRLWRISKWRCVYVPESRAFQVLGELVTPSAKFACTLCVTRKRVILSYTNSSLVNDN